METQWKLGFWDVRMWDGNMYWKMYSYVAYRLSAFEKKDH